MLDLKAQLHLLQVTLWGWFFSFVVKMICSSLSVTVFICNPKCGANFLSNKHNCVTCTWGPNHESPCNTILHSFIYQMKANWIFSKNSYRRCCPGTPCSSSNFIFKAWVFKTRSPVACILLKTWEAKVHSQFLFSFLFWNYTGFQWGHCTAIWIIDFNWFNLVLKWAKTQALSLSEGSKRGAWSSTHL